jgi:hypothetical protein
MNVLDIQVTNTAAPAGLSVIRLTISGTPA